MSEPSTNPPARPTMLPEELEEGIQRSSTEETPNPTPTAPLPPSPKQYATSLFDNPIDLSQKHGVIAYNEGCEPLDLDNKFEGKISQIAPFLDAVLERMQNCCMQDIFTVSVNGKNIDLLTHYSQVPEEALIAACDNRRRPEFKTDLKKIQPELKSKMLYKALMSSISDKVKRNLRKYRKKINLDGPLLFKMILDVSHITTEDVVFQTTTDIMNLDLTKLRGYNVDNLHSTFNNMATTLDGAGNPVSDAYGVVALFNAYQHYDNPEWLEYVRHLRTQYQEKTFTTVDELQAKTSAKFSEMCKAKPKRWNAEKKPSDDPVLALQARTSNSQSSNSTDGFTTTNKKTKNKWKFDKSLSTTNTYVRKVNNKETTYKWCTGPGHGGKAMWVTHDPAKCKKLTSDSGTSSGTTSGNTSDPAETIQMMRSVLENASFGDDPGAMLQAIKQHIK